MQFKFKVNPDYVFLHAIGINQPTEPFPDWGKFTNQIYEKDPEIFYLLAGSAAYVLYPRGRNIAVLAKRAEEVLKNARRTEEYQKLIKETEKYKEFVEKQWLENGRKALEILKDLSGLDLPKDEITVYLTHPKLCNGMAIDKRTIVWGHPEDYKNYTTVYLCHELMHLMTFDQGSEVMHAMIELLVDNELRIKLNGGGEYFEYEGHPELRKLVRKILPEWRKYLEQEDHRILDFFRQIKKEVN